MEKDDQPLLELSDRGAEEEAPTEELTYGLSDSDIEDIVEALHSGYDDVIVSKIQELSASKAAELIGKIGDEDREALISRHGSALNPDTYAELDTELLHKILPFLSASRIAGIIAELDSDDALSLLLDLDEDFQKQVTKHLSAKTRLELAEGMSFPEDSAGRLMQREFVAIPQFWTVGKTIDYLRAAASELPEDFYDIFVITPLYKIRGQIPLSRLLCARRSEKVDNSKIEDISPVPAAMDQEDVARMFKDENITSAPVVDEEDRLIGVITIDDIVDVIDEEAGEDLFKLSGVEEGDLYRAVFSTSFSRLRWLSVNLFTALAAATVVSSFDATIEKLVALAALMPVVASMGGNAGTQALAVAVRALATKELSTINEPRIILKEIGVGALNGTMLAIFVGLVATLWFHNPTLGLVIGAALIINLIVAGFFGASVPIILNKLGADPAVPSSVFLTATTDVVGFFVFLGLATIFLI